MSAFLTGEAEEPYIVYGVDSRKRDMDIWETYME